uniref:Zinc finger protein 4 n=1 Tax=Cajanus cajan TaxID=3821 RepID=A0A151RBK9_CAJCA|nr:Zinc finger protein 4 [Cajanus cajan]
MKPNFDLEVEACAEYESEVSSQVASNVSIQETSADAISLDLTLQFKNSIKAHSSLHHGFTPTMRPPEVKNNARFDQGYVGLPIFVEDDESDLLWPGSFRQVAEASNSHPNFILTGSSNLSFTEVNPPLDIENSKPDLTLKL